MSGLRSFRLARGIEVALLVVGIGLRAYRFLEHRPLWIDEALLAMNVLPHGPADFLQPIGFGQISPLGFLLGEWLVTRLGGTGEQALRFLPFVASAAALIAFNRFSRRTLEPAAALFATALVAFSPLLISYGGELKSYSFDSLCAVLLMLATLSLAEGQTPRAWVRWGLTAAFGALMSTPAPFFVGGCALALLTVKPIRTVRGLVQIGLAAAPAALLFILQLTTTYNSPFTRQAMTSAWSRNFIDSRFPDALIQALQLARPFVVDVLFGDRIAEALPRKTITIIVLLSGIGALLLVRRSRTVAAIVLAPALLTAIGALMHRWPLTPRLLLFLVPTLVITLTSSFAGLSQILPQRARGLALAAVSALFIVGATAGIRWEWNENNLVIPLPDALRMVRQASDSSTTIYLSRDLVAACRYYLAWHPDRGALGGGLEEARRDTTTMCSFRDRKLVTGAWPEFVRRPAGAAFDAPMPVRPDWVGREGGRILAATPVDGERLWMVLAHSRQLQDALAPWLEHNGFRRIREERRRTLLLLEYVKAPS